MGIVFRQSIKSTIVTFLGAILGAFCNIAYVNVLEKQANGFRTTVFDQATILQIFVLLGTTGTLMTYIQRYPAGDKRKLLQTFSLLVPLTGTVLMLVPYLLFKEDIIRFYAPKDQDMVGRFYIWIPLLTLLWSYLNQMDAYLTGLHKSAVSAFVREVMIRIINLVLIGLLYYGYISFAFFLAGCILTYALAFILLIPVAMKTVGFGFSMKWSAFSKQEYRELIHFSWYHMLTAVSIVAIVNVGSYMLGIFSANGLDAVSVYGVAIFISTIMIIPYRAMATAAFPSLNMAYTNNEMTKLAGMFSRAAVNTLIVSVLMTVLIACNLHNVLFILRKGYDDIIPLVLILLLGRLIDTATGLNTEVIIISKYYKFNYRISMLLVVILIGFNYLLIPRYDVYGAAWGTTIALTIFNVCKVIFLWKKMGLHPFSKHTLPVLLTGVAAAAAGYLLPELPHFVADVIVRSTVIVAVYGGLMLWLKPSEDLRTYLKSVKENKRLF
jgi:O-antigen/teichoic acid export membrane protein